MHDVGALWLAGAAGCALAGMAWLALAMPVHSLQVFGRPLRPGCRRSLRTGGAVCLVASLGCSLMSSHPSMAVLVWVMLLSAAALATAVLLALRPGALRRLWPFHARIAGK
ncbi:MAG TPA: DUF3325 family protein [Luteimonas sp.]